MAKHEIEVELLPAPNDPKIHEPGYQKELGSFSEVLRHHGVKYSQRGMAFDSISAHGFALGEYILPLATAMIGALTTACGAWLKGRYGRKIRLKIGDVEVEARTIEEVDTLLKRIDGMRIGKQNDS